MPWIVGATLTALGCTSLSVGLNLEKLSLVQNEKRPAGEQRVCYRQKLWLLGFFLFVLGNVLNFLSLSFASSSLLAPLGSISIIVNAIASTVLLGETFTRGDFFCLAYIVGGCTLAVIFSAHDSRTDDFDVSSLPSLVLRTPFVIISLASVASGTASFLFISRDKGKDKSVFLPFAYSFISGLFGSLSFLSSKVVSMILSSGNIWTYPYHFLIPSLVMLVIGATRQIKWMNLGLTRCEALVVLPSYYAFSIVLQMLTGGVFFHEFRDFLPMQSAGFGAGIFTCLLACTSSPFAQLVSKRNH